MSFNGLMARTWRFNCTGEADVLELENLPVALPAAGEAVSYTHLTLPTTPYV